MDDLLVRCHYCARRNSNLRRCSRCQSVYYCTKVCQTIDWPEHKTSCATLTQKSTSSNKDVNIRKIKRKKERKNRHGRNVREKEEQDEEDDDIRNSDTFQEGLPHKDQETKKPEIAAEGEIRAIMKSEYGDENVQNEITGYVTGTEQKDEQYETTEKSYTDKTEESSKNDSEASDTESSREQNDPTTDNASRAEEARSVCGFCGSSGFWRKCSKCKEKFYCSKECQSQDWKNHKSECKKKLSEEEERILSNLKERDDSLQKWREDTKDMPKVFNFGGSTNRFFATLSPQQALMRASRPFGSLARAVRLARIFFPLYDIVTEFDDIPTEPMFPFFPFMMMPPRGGYVLVAFMYRYHEHVMRHGVYLKDAMDRESKVEFYLDFDNPFPYFSYAKVRPGGYICLVEPVMHFFMDGTVGIRINNPEEVKVLDIETVMR